MKTRIVQSGEREIVTQRFLASFIENGGDISSACQVAGVSIATILTWKVNNPEFQRAFNQAKDLSTVILESEAVKRATVGEQVPVFHQGRVVGTKVEKSDTLLTFLLKARKPDEYGDKNKVIIQSDNSKDITDVLAQAISDTDDVKYIPAIDGMNTVVVSDVTGDELSSKPVPSYRGNASAQDVVTNATIFVSAPNTTARKRRD